MAKKTITAPLTTAGLSLIPLGLIIASWAWLASVKVSTFQIPQVDAVAVALYTSRLTLLSDAFYTLIRSIASFVLGSALGVLLGWLVGWRAVFYRLLGPPIYLLSAAPPIAFLPVILVWLGIGSNLYIAMGVIGAFFPAAFAAVSGARSVSSLYIDVARDNGASEWQILRNVLLPNALPVLASGIRLAFTTAFILEVDAEIIISNPSQQGIGIFISYQNALLNLQDVFAGVAFLAFMGIAVLAFSERLERWLAPWRE